MIGLRLSLLLPLHSVRGAGAAQKGDDCGGDEEGVEFGVGVATAGDWNLTNVVFEIDG